MVSKPPLPDDYERELDGEDDDSDREPEDSGGETTTQTGLSRGEWA